MDEKNYFSWHEFIQTQQILDNTISSSSHLVNLAGLWDYLNTVRQRLGAPIYINSAFRSPAVNQQVGGAKRSLHMQGRAADIRTKREYMSRLRQILLDDRDDLSEFIEYETFFHVAI